jgi:DHA1 family bicyclomycin/chloramphenicol resistance-like MFS transporter
MNAKDKGRGFWREAIVLGFVALAGPLAMNMYVPAFPEMAKALNSSSATIQLSLVSYLAALACGQNFFGPLSDCFGRKAALYAGLTIFLIASTGASLSGSAEELIIWRFCQGFGACAAMAVPRAIIRDRYTGSAAARMMSLMLLVMSVGPLLAPLAGTALVEVFGWRSIFWGLIAAGAAGLAAVLFLVRETLPVAERASGAATLRSYAPLLRDRGFICTALMIGLAQATYFAFLSGSPFVFMTMYDLTTWQFSLVFAVNAVAWSGSAQFAGWLMDRFGTERLLLYCAGVAVAVTGLLFVLATFALSGIVVLIVGIVLVFASLGIMLPVESVLALHPYSASAGAASAVLGTVGFAAGALASLMVAALADGTDLPMLGVMAVCALLSAAAARVALRKSTVGR